MKVTTRVPVLSGSTKKNRDRIAAWARTVIAHEKALAKEMRTSCVRSDPAGELEVVGVSAKVYAKRYASVEMTVYSYAGCRYTDHDAPHSLTLDLKTGKHVALGTFVAPTATVTQLAVASRLKLTPATASCAGTLELPPYGADDLLALPKTAAWTVSSTGVRFWFKPASVFGVACGVMATTVPWKELAKASRIDGPRVTRVYVRGLKLAHISPELSWLEGDIALLGAQDRQVAIVRASLDGDGTCALGVRSGKKFVGYSPYGDPGGPTATRSTATLGGTYAKPTLKLGAGWRLATAADLKLLKKQTGVNPFEWCGVDQ